MAFWIPLTVTEHCFAKAILEGEIMVKGRKKEENHLQRQINYNYISDEREKKERT